MFKETMEKIGEPVAPSEIVEDVNTGLAVAKRSVIRSFSVRLIPLAAPAAVLPIMRSSAQRSWRTDSVYPVWARFL